MSFMTEQERASFAARYEQEQRIKAEIDARLRNEAAAVQLAAQLDARAREAAAQLEQQKARDAETAAQLELLRELGCSVLVRGDTFVITNERERPTARGATFTHEAVTTAEGLPEVVERLRAEAAEHERLRDKDAFHDPAASAEPGDGDGR